MNEYTFKEECLVCENVPVRRDLGMCDVCTFGEADSLWDWTRESFTGEELRLAQAYIEKQQHELKLLGLEFAPEVQAGTNRILKEGNS